MGSVAIFSGNFAKFLKNRFNLADTAYILTGTTDPRSVAADAPKGSLYLRQTVAANGEIYFKQDNGNTTAWSLVPNSLTDSKYIYLRLESELGDSPYELVTPNIIATDASSKFATLTGATYDVANGVISFGANAQVATSIQMLDGPEWLSRGLATASVDLSVFWSRAAGFSIPSSFVYEVSRDSGAHYFPISMSRVGLTDVFAGSLRFDTSTTTEATPQTLDSNSGDTGQRDLSASGANQALAQRFIIPANTTYVVQNYSLFTTKVGTPNGTISVSIVRDNAGLPSTASADILATSSSFLANSLVTGSQTITLPTTALGPGTYHVVMSSDAAYKATPSFASNKIQLTETTGSSARTFNGTVWTTYANDLRFILRGRLADLRVRITSAGSPSYPCGLDGFGIFYGLQDVGVVGASRKTQRFGFNSVTDNTSSFAITAFNPDPDLLSCYWIEGGQVFKSPAFSLQSSTAVFPPNSFNNGGISQAMTLVFDQNSGGSFDNSDSNARLLAANFLGSTSGADDRSAAGRGIFLRRPDGTLREITINNSDEIEVYSI